MTLNVVKAASARLAASLVAALALAAPALAGDRALIDFIGFSGDGKYLAFEEFGTQDGSGFPYSNIFVLDLAADKWAEGTPVRVRINDESGTATEADARSQAAEQAAPILAKLGTTEPADLVAINGDGELGDGSYLTFGRPGFSFNDVQGAYTLTMATFPAEASMDCEGLLGAKGLGLALSLSGGEQAAREIYRDDGTLPESRGCPMAYRIYAVVAPRYTTPPGGHVAIIATYPFGFEGPDRRFIAIPLGQ